MGQRRDTKTLILDAAEALFAERNFEAVSVREITGKAGVRLGLASYYFKSKQILFEAVIARRASLLGQRRRDRLRALQIQGSADVENVLAAFIGPYVEFCLGAEPGWRNYSRLIAQATHDTRWISLIDKHFNPTALVFLDALQEALPNARPEAVLRAFVMTIQIMVSAFAMSGRLESLSFGAIDPGDHEATFASLTRFLAAGFQTLPADSADS